MLKLLGVFVVVVSLAAGYAQVPARPEFEAATVKPNASGDRSSGIGVSNGSLVRITNYTLKGMIQFAYDVRDFQIAGGPGWLDEDRFDVIAKPETQAKNPELRQMMQSMLADRFHLKVHRETREGAIYELHVARGGSKLTPSAPGENSSTNSSGSNNRNQMKATGVMMEGFVTNLSQIVQRPVVDKTGLAGRFDFELTYSSDLAIAAAGGTSTDVGPSLFTALQEQLGLRLDSAKGPVEVIVIDQADKPEGVQ